MNNPIRVVEGNAKPYEPFWQVRDAAQTGGDPEIDFVGYISEFSWFGDEITPKKFKDDLYNVGKGGPVTIRMHSGGGEIFAAAAIRAMLIDYPGKKTVKIDGLAASAAVAIALAGDTVKIFDTSYMMVHNPGYGALMGYLDADTMEKFAAELRLFKEGLLNAYESRTRLDRKALSAMMDEETWMTAQQAVELGFADEVITGGSPIKKDLAETVRNYAHVPQELLNLVTTSPDNSGDGRDESNAASAAHVADTGDDGLTPSRQGQEPETAPVLLAEARARLAQAEKTPIQGETTMNVRELLKERVTLLDRAKALTESVDAESRDFSESERAEFEEIMGKGEEAGKIGALDVQIEQIQAEREKLRAAAEKKFAPAAAEKPALAGQPSVMKRDEFEKLSAAERAAFVKASGKIQD